MYHIVIYMDGELRTSGVRNSSTSLRHAERLAAQYNAEAGPGFRYEVMTAEQFNAAASR